MMYPSIVADYDKFVVQIMPMQVEYADFEMKLSDIKDGTYSKDLRTVIDTVADNPETYDDTFTIVLKEQDGSVGSRVKVKVTKAFVERDFRILYYVLHTLLYEQFAVALITGVQNDSDEDSAYDLICNTKGKIMSEQKEDILSIRIK